MAERGEGMSRLIAIAAAAVFLSLGTAQAGVEKTKNIYCASKDCWGSLNVGENTEQTINGYCGVESNYKDGSIKCSTKNVWVTCSNSHSYQCNCNASEQSDSYAVNWSVTCN